MRKRQSAVEHRCCCSGAPAAVRLSCALPASCFSLNPGLLEAEMSGSCSDTFVWPSSAQMASPLGGLWPGTPVPRGGYVARREVCKDLGCKASLVEVVPER